MKLCWWCKHFSYCNSENGWSELTPGGDFYIDCRKKRWEFDAKTTTQKEFAKIIQYAEKCDSYEKINPEKDGGGK